MNPKFSVPRGTTDILPDQISLWQDVERKSRSVLKTYGYKEIRTPYFEETELFARSMGQTSDVVQKQMLQLMSQKTGDAGDIQTSGLSLRPEGTASVVRSYIENHLDKKEQLSKLFYIGPMFRGERPQKGRLRQFHQIGVEAIGPDSCLPYLDAEVIALAVQLFNELGLKGFELKLNTLGSTKDRENFSKILRQELKKKDSDLCPDCQNRIKKNVFRILDCKNRSCRSIVAQLKLDHSYLTKESRTYYSEVCAALDNLGIEYVQSPALVRGLDYYTHTVFEISHAGLGSQDALGAGGRYNDLISQLGGPKVDAIGFALGMERMMLAMPEVEGKKKNGLLAYVVAMDEAAFKQGFQILKILRSEGIPSDISYRLGSMKSMMRQADKNGASYVIIIGEEEMQKNFVTCKDMISGEQIQFPLESINQLTSKLSQQKG